MVRLDLLPLHCWASLHWRVCPVVLVVDLWKTLESRPVEIIGLPHRLYTLYVMARNQKCSKAETVEK